MTKNPHALAPATSAPAVARWALVIGIDRYPNLPEHAQLTGAANDARVMRGLLTDRFSFPPDHVELLENEAATRVGIRAGLRRLLARLGPHDVAVIHYSGHGSRAADPTSPDGKCETIVPCDSGRAPFPNRDIRDTELHRWLQRLSERTAHLTLIFDSCYSGHVLRDPFGSRGRWVEEDSRPPVEDDDEPAASAETVVPDGSGGALRGLDGASLPEPDAPAGGAARNRGLHLPLSSSYVLLAACRSDETAFEIPGDEGVQHGAFTWFVCQDLARAGATTTFRDVFEEVAPRVNARYPSQHPQLEGARDHQVFGLAEIEPVRFVPAAPAGEGAVALSAGAACGLTLGSIWKVYPPGTKTLAAGVRPVARVKVTSVRALSSDARLLAGTVGEGGGRAVETTHCYGEARFTVALDREAARLGRPAVALRNGIARSPLLALHDGDAAKSATAIVYLLRPRQQAASGAPVPSLAEVRAESWAVVGEDGELLMPVHPAAAAGAVSLLIEGLEKRARFRAAIQLSDPQGPLSGSVRLAVLRQGGRGERWIECAADDRRTAARFRAGDRIAFRLSHRHSSPLYLYLLDFGLSGAISLIYPAMGGEQKGSPGGHTVLVGTEAGDEIVVRLPSNFPYAGSTDAPREGWIETVKLFATSAESDFGPLLQQAVRGASPASETPLARLLRASLTGHVMRDTERARPAGQESWTVVQRCFRVVP